MISLWVAGDSLAHNLTYLLTKRIPKPTFQKHTVYAAPQTADSPSVGPVLASEAAALLLHSPETSHRCTRGRHLNISWTRCAEIDWAEEICPARSALFTPISRFWAHLCWQRTRREIVIRSVPLRFNYFYPTVDSAVLEWHHSSISMLNHLYSAGQEVDLRLNLFPARINYTAIVHADNHWTKYGARPSPSVEESEFSQRHFKAIVPPEVSLTVWLWETSVLRLPGRQRFSYH